MDQINICNIAITRVGGSTIQSLEDEDKEESLLCRTMYDLALEAALRDHDWAFARARTNLALLPDEYAGWTYAYRYPSDCVNAREIFNPNLAASVVIADEHRYTEGNRIPFEIAASLDHNSKVILTEQEDAMLIYTAKITNPNVYDPQFIDAFAWRLASDLAQPLRGDSNLQTNLLRAYFRALTAAQTKSSNENRTLPDVGGAYLVSRR